MFRIWGKIMKDNRLVKDHTVCIEDYTMTRTKKVYAALDELCYTFDLAKPIWLKSNQQDFIRHAPAYTVTLSSRMGWRGTPLTSTPSPSLGNDSAPRVTP